MRASGAAGERERTTDHGGPMPEHLAPMLASPGRLPREDEQWAFEVKWDGVRAILYRQSPHLRIESRNGNDLTARYPELRALGDQLDTRRVILDGEIIAFDEQNRPSFQRLQRRMHVASESAIHRLAREIPVTYVIFDLLYLEDRLTIGLPYAERRALLEGLQLTGRSWQTPSYHRGDGASFLGATAEHGLEGVVAKRLDSIYRPGARAKTWLKVKNMSSQELVIGGWLAGKGRRAGQIGALLMGYHDQRDSWGRLRYAGRVGTGFDEADLELLGAELGARQTRESPFAKQGVQPPPQARFVEPSLVAEVEFSHWTREGVMRHPSYKGLRSDKAASEVVIERFERPYRLLHETKRYTDIQVDGRRLRLSNRHKVLYPQAGFTKGELIDYYADVSPVLLPHLQARPLTLKRYPDGVEGPHFYEKRCPSHRPDWVRTAAIWSDRQRQKIEYCLVEDLPTLIWAGNLADIELHTSLSRADDMATPTATVFDLDPGAPAGMRECCRVALQLKELFDAVDLRVFVKTSGAKGLQVYLPVNAPVSYEQTKSFARAVAELLAQRHPRSVVASMARGQRTGRVLIDWSQNDEHKTTVSVYSLRARERPTISTPLLWEEVEDGARSRRRDAASLSAEPEVLLERVRRYGDLFAPLLTLVQTLPHLESGQEAARFYATSSGGSPGATRQGIGGVDMPPRGVKKGSKRERQYEHIKESQRERGVSLSRAEEIAARTVNKERARGGESRSSSSTSTRDISSGRRGGLRSGRPGPRGRTRDQLYEEARKLGVQGRSRMNKAQLQRAVDNSKR